MGRSTPTLGYVAAHSPRKWTLTLASTVLIAGALAGCQLPPGNPSAGSPRADTTAGAPDSAADATAQLAQLTVDKAGSMKGYSRDKFPHWRSTGANCDVRDS